MFIILEGPDGAGKTTLAKQLSRQTGFEILHRDKPKTRETKETYKDYLALLEDSTGKDLILDRCWYSEMVYGIVKRDKSTISYPDMYKLEKVAAEMGGLIIHCTASIATLWQRCVAKGESYIKVEEDLNRIVSAYWELMKLPHYLPVTTYEYEEV